MENNTLKSITLDIKNPKYGDKFNFFAKQAEVVSEPQIWTETHISSSGGGGHVHPEHGGYVSAPTIYSNVIERERYFVKFSNGSEIELRDVVSARKGHSIYLIYGGFEGQDNYLVATYNPQTGKCVLCKPRYYGKYFTDADNNKWFTIRIIILSIISLSLLALITIPSIIYLVKRRNKGKKIVEELDVALFDFMKNF
ncbi:MAG: hypothetical protein ACYCTB_10980 [bacterium]